MTVQTNTTVATGIGNGVTSVFPIPFKFNRAEDLIVYLVIQETEEEIPLTLHSDYTVTGAGNENGGNLTMLAGPLPVGQSVVAQRIVDLRQLTDLRNQGRFFAEVHEDVFDKLVMIDQQQQTHIDRAMVVDLLWRWNALNRRIINVGDPIADKDAAHKRYVDQGDNDSRSYADSRDAHWVARTLRTADPLSPLPGPEARASKLLSFDSTGRPVVVAPEPQSATELALQLADPDRGAAMVARSVVTVESLTELSNLPRNQKLTAQLVLGGRSGPFFFTSDDLSEQVANDSLQGIYVAPASDLSGASGAWVRQYGQAVTTLPDVSPGWFGAPNTGEWNNPSIDDDYPAIVAAASACALYSGRLNLEGRYNISAPLDLTLVDVYLPGIATIIPRFEVGVAVTWGSTSELLSNRQCSGEGFLFVSWPTADWSKNRISFEIINSYTGYFKLSSTRATISIKMRANGRGCVYNDLFIGNLSNHCVGAWLESDTSSGWVNANRFIGGRWSGAGATAGALFGDKAGHIYVAGTPYANNGNAFLHVSLEWANADNFQLFRIAGNRNQIVPIYMEMNHVAGAPDPDTWATITGSANTVIAHNTPYAGGASPTGTSRIKIAPGTNANRVVSSFSYEDYNQGRSVVTSQNAESTTLLQNRGLGRALILQQTGSSSRPALGIRRATETTDSIQIPASGPWIVSDGTTKVVWNGSIPTSGDWTRGDKVYFNNPSAGAFVGAVCVTSGSPGVWKRFGQIEE